MSSVTGLEKISALIARLGDAVGEVDVGFIGQDARKLYVASDTREPVTVAEVAHWQEYGTQRNGREHIPARPFLRRASAAFNRDRDAVVKKAVGQVVANDAPGHVVLEALAKALTAEVHGSLQTTAQWADPLAPSTVERKGSNWPLHETMQLSTSLSWEARSESGGTSWGRK